MRHEVKVGSRQEAVGSHEKGVRHEEEGGSRQLPVGSHMDAVISQ